VKKNRVAFLTIGQSPRDDVIHEIKPLLSPSIEVVQHGLLDHLNSEEIERLRPAPEDTLLVSRLRDGSQVELDEKKISVLLYEAVELMKTKMSVEAAGILCTHEFPTRQYPVPVIFPFTSVQFLLKHVLEVENLGAVVPSENQIEMARKKWGENITSIEAKTPYSEGKPWEEIAENFAQKNVSIIVLDCIGYTNKDRQAIQDAYPIPTLLPKTLLVYAINQLF
jgi:protein AroM